jgi:hypothetical protein
VTARAWLGARHHRRVLREMIVKIDLKRRMQPLEAVRPIVAALFLSRIRK